MPLARPATVALAAVLVGACMPPSWGAGGPVEAARGIQVPVLLIHGREDEETPPAHSEHVYAALAGPRRLLMVDGAGHEDALGKAWTDVEAWIDEISAPRESGAAVDAPR